MSATLGRVASAYNSLLTKAPMLTNSATGFVVAALGDVVTQRYLADLQAKQAQQQASQNKSSATKALSTTTTTDNKNDWWDSKRTLEMAFIRAAIVAPFVFYWYPFVMRAVPGRALHRVLGRVCFDQTFGSPLVVVMVFTASSLLQGRGLAGAIQRIREKGVRTWVTGLSYWPFVHTINFGVVPGKHQPLFAHFASLYWNAVLSYYANMKLE